MPSKKGTDQALIWLRSKMEDEDMFESINAEICYNVICDLRKKRREMGVLYGKAKEALQKYKTEDPEIDILYEKTKERDVYDE